jgi:hypothetical protein
MAFPTVFRTWLAGLGIDNQDTNKYTELCADFEKPPPTASGITLEEVGTMKSLCDSYLLKKYLAQRET